MTFKQFHRWLALPLKIANLVTPNRLERLWYYLRTNQSSIIFDRVKRLLELGTATPMSLHLYSPSDNPGPIIFPVCNTPLVTIVIPVFNQWDTTRACLLSIQENTQGTSYEIIIADDCSHDDTRNLAELAPGVHHRINSENQGFLRNCNQATMQAKGKYLLLLNNDTQVQPNWLGSLVELAEQDERIGIAGPMLLYPDGRLQEAGGIIWQDGSGWNYGRFDYPEKSEYNYLKEVDYISGACILIRKSIWDDIGGFDERFAPAYYEDTDLAFEARRRGYKVIYQPLSHVIHLEGVSHGTDLKQGVKSRQKINQSVFREKWATILDATHGHGPRDLFRARDRSLRRKRLLFVDHYVPLRDQDAGSKSTYQYLSLMSEMGYQITFLGDNFVDYQPYTSELQQLGIEVLYGPGLNRHWKRWLKTHGENFDYVYLSRPHITKKYLPHILKCSSAKILYCGHDLHFLREERHYQLEKKHIHLQASKKWALFEEAILRKVDIGYFFSEFEIEEVRRRFPGTNVRTIPLYIFENRKNEQLASSSMKFCNRKGLLFVGGFMHEPNVDAVLWFVEKIMPLIVEKLPEVALTVVGSNPPKEISCLNSEHVYIAGRVSEETLLQYYDQTKLVVAPLRFGAGVKGKIVESMHQGVPTVTTTVGAEGIGDADKALIIADEAITFADAVVRAYTDPAIWDSSAYYSVQAIQKHFSKEAARKILSQDMPL